LASAFCRTANASGGATQAVACRGDRTRWLDIRARVKVKADCRYLGAGSIPYGSRAAIPVLEKDGWLFWPDDPNYNYRLWFLRPSPSARTHHLQLIQYDHPNLRALIVFRDALRQDRSLRKAYSSLKDDLARKHQSNCNAYSNAKTEFVQSVLEAAGVSPSSRTPV
jgi:GrpB protein